MLTATELLDLLREAGEGCCGGCGKSACEATDRTVVGSDYCDWANLFGVFKKK